MRARPACGRSRVRSSGPATFFRCAWSWNHFYGHSLHTTDSSRQVVSYWQNDVHLVLVNSVVRSTDRLDMTLVVDRNVKSQIKQTKVRGIVPEIRGQVKNLATYLYKTYRVFINILFEENDMKIVEKIACTLKIHAKVPLLVGLAGGTQNVLTRYYAVSNLNSAERLFSMNFTSKCASFEITFILILFLKVQNEFVRLK